MVAIRRHNPYQRNRSKKGSIAKQVRLVFWALLAFSLLLAFYLLRRVGQSQSLPYKTEKKSHTVGIGDHHHGKELPGLHSNLRNPPKDAPRQHNPPPTATPSAAEQFSPTASPVKQTSKVKQEVQVAIEDPANPDSAAVSVNQPANPKGAAQLQSIVVEKQGSGPTNVGFVKDLEYERSNPDFLNAKISAEEDAAHVLEIAKLSGAALRSCAGPDGSLSDACKDNDTVLYAYNSANFSRAICGVDVGPRQVVKLDSVTEHNCLTEPTRHIMPQDVIPWNATAMPPIKVLAHNDPSTSTVPVKCDVPCEYETALLFTTGQVRQERYIQGEDWTIMYDSYESPKPMEKGNWKRDIYYSTLSRQSSIPISEFDFSTYNFRDVPELEFKFLERGATYFAEENCQNSATRRHKWINALSAKFPVKAYGHCQHNTDGNVTTMENRLKLMRKHRLVLAYETSTEKDAFTRLTWEALQAGVVPVIVGPGNALDALPPRSFIWYGYYNNWDKFSEDVARIADDQELYDSYRSWRKDEAALSAFEAHMNFTRTEIKCRTCRWAYAKKYSLHWDAEQQLILPSTIPRDEFCTSSDEHALLMKPFKEVWLGRGGEGKMNCNSQAIDQEISIEAHGHKITRRIFHHDGVTDISISELDLSDADGPIGLRLEFNIQNNEGASFPHAHTSVESNNHHLFSSSAIQDMSSRATVIADWRTVIETPEPGVVEVMLPDALEESRRIRIIIEDVDLVNYKLTEFYPFSFGKKMTQDFANPMEMYHPTTAR